MKVSEIFDQTQISIEETATLEAALLRLLETKHNSMFVVNSSNEVVGTLSIQTIAKFVIPEEFFEHTELGQAMYRPGLLFDLYKDKALTPVKNFMDTEFETVTLETNAMTAICTLLENNLYTLPVIDNNKKPIGVISRSEIKTAFDKCRQDPSA